MNRILLTALIIIVLLIAALGVAVLLLRKPEPLPEGTREATAEKVEASTARETDQPEDKAPAIPRKAAIEGRFEAEDGETLPQLTFVYRRNSDPGMRARTDDNGAFNLSGLEPGNYTFSIPPGSYPEPGIHLQILKPDLTLSAGEKRRDAVLRIRIEEIRLISGQVIDSENQPLPDTKVTCDDARITITQTDQSGRFQFDIVEGVDKADLFFSRGNYDRMIIEDIAVGTTDLQVAMERGGAVAGKVISAETRKPVESFSFHLDQDIVNDDWNAAVVVDRNFDSPEGTFRFEGIVPGTIVIDVTAEGFARERMKFPILDGEVIGDLVFEMKTESAIRGSVIGEKTRRAIPDVRIYVGRLPVAEKDEEYDAITDNNGVFTLTNLNPEGTIQLGLVPENGFAPKLVTILPTESPVVIHLPESGVFSGQVTFQGQPVAGAPVTLYTTDNGYGEAMVRFRRTDKNGQFYFDPLPAAHYIVETGNPLDPNARMQRTSIDVEDGFETSYNFDF